MHDADDGKHDPYRIRDEAELRAVIGAEIPGIAAKNINRLDEFAQRFIAQSPFLILATANAQHQLDASPKGDAPGFVKVEDERTLLIPDRAGNKLAYGHLNILQNPRVGLIFMIPGMRETLRVNGSASLHADPIELEALGAGGKPAVLAIRVAVEEVFFHCAKAFIRSRLWQAEDWPQPYKISFGEMLAARQGAGDEVAKSIDAAVEQDYRDNL